MRELLERLRVPLLFGLLVVVSLVAIASDRRAVRGQDASHAWWSAPLLEVVVPVEKILAVPANAVRGVWSRYVDLVGVKAENARLRSRVTELQEENLQYREALVAGGRLKRIAAMREQFSTPMRPAEVVGQDVSPWFRSVLIDRGNARGVRTGMPVITGRGVVGLVTASTPNAARTMLLLDRQSRIDGIVERSRARGIVRGTGTDRLDFAFVMRGDDVKVGDVVITSGLGGVYPKGLRIGQVVRVIADQDRLLQKAVLRPAVDFGRLEQVFVMLTRPRSLDLLYGGQGDMETSKVGTSAGRAKK